jgi:dTDP-4-dehydrorhamnose 3,5-epimerase
MQVLCSQWPQPLFMPFKVIHTQLSAVVILPPKVFGDERGFFFESFHSRDFSHCTGLDVQFVQVNHSKSSRGVLRGLHCHIQHSQGKLVQVTQGEVFDVAVDMRRSSPTFGKCAGVVLSAENKHQLWVRPGFAHGFVVTRESAEFLYKTNDYYFPEFERSLLWNDRRYALHGQNWLAPRNWQPKTRRRQPLKMQMRFRE